MSEPGSVPPGWGHNDSLQQWEYRRDGRVVATAADELLAGLPPAEWRSWLLGPVPASDFKQVVDQAFIDAGATGVVTLAEALIAEADRLAEFVTASRGKRLPPEVCDAVGVPNPFLVVADSLKRVGEALTSGDAP